MDTVYDDTMRKKVKSCSHTQSHQFLFLFFLLNMVPGENIGRKDGHTYGMLFEKHEYIWLLVEKKRGGGCLLWSTPRKKE